MVHALRNFVNSQRGLVILGIALVGITIALPLIHAQTSNTRLVTAGVANDVTCAVPCISTGEIVAGAVTGGAAGVISDGTINVDDIGTAAVAGDELAAGAVTAAGGELADNAVTDVKLAAGAIQSAQANTATTTTTASFTLNRASSTAIVIVSAQVANGITVGNIVATLSLGAAGEGTITAPAAFTTRAEASQTYTISGVFLVTGAANNAAGATAGFDATSTLTLPSGTATNHKVVVFFLPAAIE